MIFRRPRRLLPALLLALTLMLLVFAAGCSPAAAPVGEEPSAPPANNETVTGVEQPSEARPPPQPTQPRAVEPLLEQRSIELEWPEQLRLGDSDVIRLALVPYKDGYIARAEFSEHTLATGEVTVPHREGYQLFAVAELSGVGFDIAPAGQQVRYVPPGEEVAWRWSLAPRSPGQHRLAVQLHLRWEPGQPGAGLGYESLVYQKGLNVQVTSFLGLSRSQAAAAGVAGLLAGGGMLLFALAGSGLLLGRPVSGSLSGGLTPVGQNPNLNINAPPGMVLHAEEAGLLRALFNNYAQVMLKNEFLSGYSGARTFLVLPVRPDGCADALTIVKVGSRSSIQNEFSHYEAYVKDRLPPMTARIQRPPVVLSDGHTPKGRAAGQRAAVQYTFIAEPGRSPVSLRQALLKNPDPALLLQLFETFGPNWWMQRRPHPFRLSQEYDTLLPPHLVLKPVEGSARLIPKIILHEKSSPEEARLAAGDLVLVRAFQQVELRADGCSYSLTGLPLAGRPPLRLRWLGTRPPAGTLARVTAGRMDLLYQWAAGFDPAGLPGDLADPLACLPTVLDETISGTRSVIHGDLNLENVLVGPGSLVWLIDFAQTREGHPLYDFAHLESELIAHILAPQAGSPAAYLDHWRTGGGPLVEALHAIAGRCLFDPARPREYHLALYLACLGALKYANLSELARHCLYLTAADLVEKVRA